MPNNASTQPETRRRWLRRAGPLAVLLIVAAVLFAACGGGSSDPSAAPAAKSSSTTVGSKGSSTTVGPSAPSSTSGGSTSSSSSKRSGPAYAQCMRQHGVTDFPDPVGPNQGGFLIPQSVEDNPDFQSASQACASLQPQGPGSSGGGTSSGGVSQAQLLQFAQCMRSNGVPNFPDPSSSGEVNVQGVNTSSPQFQSALQTCETKTGLQFGGQ